MCDMWCFLVALNVGVRVVHGSTPPSCSQLERQRTLPHHDIRMRIDNEESDVRVMGAGAVSRPAAALLWALLRHGLGYSARLQIASPDVCQLSSRNYSAIDAVSVVAPVAMMPKAGCGASSSWISSYSGSELNDFLHFMAHVPDKACAANATEGVLHIDETILRECRFIQVDSYKNFTTVENCEHSELECNTAVLVRNESKIFIDQLWKIVNESKLPLQIVYFQTESQWIQQLIKFQKQTLNFLFFDGDIWADNINVLKVKLFSGSSIWTILRGSFINFEQTRLIGDGHNMKYWAPNIFRVVQHFTTNISTYYGHLRQILLSIKESPVTHEAVEEAACTWAIQNYEKFKQLLPQNINDHDYKLNYTIYIYICTDDELQRDERKNMKTIIKLLNKYSEKITYDYKLRYFDCHGDSLESHIKFLESQNVHNKNDLKLNLVIAGAVTWGWTPAAKMIAQHDIPLFLAGPTAPEVLLKERPQIRATSGSLIDIIRAYQNLFKLCEWSRIAILSDNSSYSKTFINHFNLGKNKVLHQEIIIFRLSDIPSVIERLRAVDARIILVNTNWKIACDVLCFASKQGMVGTEYVWIVRNWRTVDCGQGIQWQGMHHYTLELMLKKDSIPVDTKKLQSELFNAGNSHYQLNLSNEILAAINNDSSGLTGALMELGLGLDVFLRNNPSHMYTFHKENVNQLPNITDKIILPDHKTYRRDQLVLVNKWNGNTSNIVATWHVTPLGVLDVELSAKPINTIRSCEDILGYKPVDRPFCLIPSSHSYVLGCHDVLVTISIAVLILIFLLLYAVYRWRLLSIRKHREQYEKYLIASRQQATSILDGYLVKRDSIQLFHLIGLGSYGQIWFAKLHKSSTETIIVAAKEPRESFGVEEENEFLREACILALLSHKNIIRLVGVCLGEGPILVLMEHALYNDLQQYLTQRRQYVEVRKRVSSLGSITAEQAMETSDEELTRLAREAAEALMYLASSRLVHRDVRAGNCLIDKNRSLKLADFGMARELDGEEPQYVTQRRALFPVLWMAPESIQSGIFSHSSDVWSLGVLLLEVATFGARPFGDWTVDRIVRYVKTGGHAPLPPDISTYTRRLVLECWQHKPEDRPNAAYVRDFLTLNPHAICPALLPPHPPEFPLFFTNI